MSLQPWHPRILVSIPPHRHTAHQGIPHMLERRVCEKWHCSVGFWLIPLARPLFLESLSDLFSHICLCFSHMLKPWQRILRNPWSSPHPRGEYLGRRVLHTGISKPARDAHTPSPATTQIPLQVLS